MPTIKITNKGTNPRMFYDAHGTRFTVPPHGGEVEAEMNQGDINHLHWQASRPDMKDVLELEGAKAEKPDGEVVKPPRVADPNAPVGTPERAAAEGQKPPQQQQRAAQRKD